MPVTASPELSRTRPERANPASARAHPLESGGGPTAGAVSPAGAGTPVVQWRNAEHGRGLFTVGVEFDGRRLITVGIRRGKSGGTLECVAIAEYPSTPAPEALQAHLRQFVPRTKPAIHVVLSTPRAAVRRYLLPPVNARQRRTAAIWEGQKLIPFPLNERDAVFGMDFVPAGNRGWWITLVAVPSEDAAPILNAVLGMEWKLRSVSLVGTQRLNAPGKGSDGKPTETEAAAIWSSRRGSFCITHDQHIQFHCDLGVVPVPAGGGQTGAAGTSDDLRRWINTLGLAIGDSLDFYVNANPNVVPARLKIIGIPEAAAPLLTDWQSRFGSGVSIVSPIRDVIGDGPAGLRGWLTANEGEVTPAILAAAYGAAIDLTPMPVRRNQQQSRLCRVARTGFLVSLTVLLAWTGLLLMRVRTAYRSYELSHKEFDYFRESAVSSNFASVVSSLTHRQALLNALGKRPVLLMPWVRTVAGTVPANAMLATLDIVADSSDMSAPGAAFSARLDGVLSPGSAPYAVTYRDWLIRLEALCGGGGAQLASERTIESHGHRASAFSIQLRPLVKSVVGEAR